MLTFWLNQEKIESGQNPATVLLDFIRRDEHLRGTKEGCREGDCGACTVLLGDFAAGKISYHAVNSCLLPLGSLPGKHVVTIEGLNLQENTLLQNAFIDQYAGQCGFCTPGFVISLTDFLLNSDKLDFDEAITAVAGNICRCTGYASIKRAIAALISKLKLKIDLGAGDRVAVLIQAGQLPDYFAGIPEKLAQTAQKSTLQSNGKIIAGGTDLFVQQAENLLQQPLQFADDTRENRHICSEDGHIIIAAGATMEDMRKAAVIRQILPRIDKYAMLVASKPIREHATLAGNIVNASPIADFAIILLALEARLELQREKDCRNVTLADFYLGYKKLNLQENEAIKSICLPQPHDQCKFNFEKVGRRSHLDIASVNSAAFFECSEGRITVARISAGGVAPVPFLLRQTNAFLSGKEINNHTVTRAMETAAREISPISDIRGSADYKRRLLQQLIFAHFHTLFPQEITAEALV